MESWFGRNVNVAPKYGLPDTTTIQIAWVLTFKRALDVYQKMMKERIWQNEAARKEIGIMLRRGNYIIPYSCFSRPFGNLSLPVQRRDEDYINQRVLGMSADLNDLNAALANFVFNVVVAGRISSDDRSGNIGCELGLARLISGEKGSVAGKIRGMGSGLAIMHSWIVSRMIVCES